MIRNDRYYIYEDKRETTLGQ